MSGHIARRQFAALLVGALVACSRSAAALESEYACVADDSQAMSDRLRCC